MGFYILNADLNDTGNAFITYSDKVEGGLDEVGNKVTDLVSNLPSFKGSAADNIKSYFADVHLWLASLIATSTEQLKTAYFDYLGSYFNSPIEETDDRGKLSEDELNAKLKRIDEWQSIWDASINSEIDLAKSALPGDVSLSRPNTHAAKAELITLKNDVNTLVNNINEAESKGKSLFSSESAGYSELLSRINTAIGRCSSDTSSLVDYSPGTFMTTLQEIGLLEAYNDSMDYIENNQEKMIQNQEIMYTQLHDREVRKQEEERAIWDGLALAATVGLLLVGVAATIATAGAAGPVVAGLTYGMGAMSALSTGADISNRVGKMMGQEKDEMVGAFGKGMSEGKKIAGFAKPGADQLDFERSDTAKNVSSSLVDKRSRLKQGQTVGKVGSYFVDKLVDHGADQLKEQYNDLESGFVIDQGKTVVGEFKDHIIDNAFAAKPKPYKVGPAEAANLVLGFAQDGADYKSAKCDQKIQELDAALEEKRESLKSTKSFSQRHSWMPA